MINLTPEKLNENYETVVKLVETYISEDRREAVLKMVKALEEEMILAPASGKVHFHGAYPGGYLVHVLNVIKTAFKLKKVYQSQGGTIDFTDEELVFTGLFHDLGKLGNGEKPAYIPQESEWHRKNQGSMYTSNPDIDFMLVQDRSLFLLQKFGIPVNQKEYLAIKLHDGLFEETNEPYWKSFVATSRLRSNLVRILHTADLLAAAIEYDIEHQEND